MGRKKNFKMWTQRIRGKRPITCVLTKTAVRYRAWGGVGWGEVKMKEKLRKESFIYKITRKVIKTNK